MTQGNLLYSVESTPRPETQLPQCTEDMYTRIANPHRFRVALAAAERLVNLYKQNREDIKPESLQDTAHHFEVMKKDVYELLRGKKFHKGQEGEEKSPPTKGSSNKERPKWRCIPKSARHVVTTLLQPPSTKDQAEASGSK